MNLFKQWTKIELENALPLLSVKFAANNIYKEEILNDPSLADVYNKIRKKAIETLEE